MSIFDIFRVGSFKKELAAATQEVAALKGRLGDALVLDNVQLRERTASLASELTKLRADVDAAHAQLRAAVQVVEAKKALVVELDDAILLQEFGLYKPKYALSNSAAYKARIEALRDRQALMVRDKTAASCAANWSLNGDEREGRRMVADYMKLIVRAFNNECDVTIDGVKFSNLDTCRKRIVKSHEVLNKLGARMSISITPSFLTLKIEELELCYEYQVKKQEEKEEQRRVREQLREEAKLAREIEEARQALAKDEKHLSKARRALEEQLSRADNEADRSLCEKEIATIANRLQEVQEKIKDVDYREANARAGYVYVISNTGAFGEGVFKIGVTRRLEPMERIDELGDASVPFDFDVHALVFSDDAFGLESALHEQFNAFRINRINTRKEFFRASIDEIEATLIGHFSKPVECIKLAEAAEYRQSLKLAELVVSTPSASS